jgi:hypothetical protein
VVDLLAGLRRVLDEHPNVASLLVEARGVTASSPPAVRLVELLTGVGLPPDEAASAANAGLATVVFARLPAGAPRTAPGGSPGGHATVLVDLGSSGVTLRAGPADGPLAVAAAGEGAASVTARGSAVVVRRPRGRGRSEVLLDPGRTWSIRVGGGTANTRLVLAGLVIDAIKVDSGAARIEAVLPRPAGVVPIEISSGVTGVRLHRPRGSAAVAQVSGGVLRLRLDSVSTLASMGDSTWASDDADRRGGAGAAAAADRYELRLNSGTVDILLDQRAPVGPPAPPVLAAGGASSVMADPGPALELLLDGIEARLARGVTRPGDAPG